MKIMVCLNPGGDVDDALSLVDVALRLAGPDPIVSVCAGADATAPSVLDAVATGTRVYIHDAAWGSEAPRTTGLALAHLAHKESASLILTGPPGGGEGLGLVPAALAHSLGITFINLCEQIDDLGDNAVSVRLRLGGRVWRIRVPLPAVLGLATSSRDASTKTAPPGLAPLRIMTAADLDLAKAALLGPQEPLGALVDLHRAGRVIGNLRDLMPLR